MTMTMTKRAAYNAMDAILKKARSENRGLTNSERDEFERLDAEYEAAALEARASGRVGDFETRGVLRPERTEADRSVYPLSSYW